jgi:protein-disulfide isomerase
MWSISYFLKEKNARMGIMRHFFSTTVGAFRADYAVMIGGIVLGIAIIVVAIIFGERGSVPVPTVNDGRTGLELIDGAPILGNADAPHTILEFFDFQCIACVSYFSEIKPRIISEFIDTGKAKLTGKILHFIDDAVRGGGYTESYNAAKAALCAHREGKFWNMYDAVYTAEADEVQRLGSNEHTGNLSPEWLLDTAQSLGIDGNAFSSCFGSREHDSVLEGYMQDAMAAMEGRVSTPSVFVDGQRLQNPFDIEEYRKLIP